MIHEFSRKIVEKIISYEIDIGFVVNPAKHPDLVLRKIGADRVIFWKSRNLKSISKNIFADMTHSQVEDALGKTHFKKFKDWSLISSPSLELIRTLTLSGQGIGILPERVAQADGHGLIPYDDSLPIYQDQIFLAYRKDALFSNAGRALIQSAKFDLNN